MTVVWPRVTVMKSKKPIKSIKGTWQKVNGSWKFVLDTETTNIIAKDSQGRYQFPL